MKDTLILKDGTTIELEAGASLGAIQVLAIDRSAMLQIWDKLTDENLAEVQIQNGSGLTVGTYKDLVLVSETSVVTADKTVVTTYNLREKTDVEKRLDTGGRSGNSGRSYCRPRGSISLLAEQIEGGEV